MDSDNDSINTEEIVEPEPEPEPMPEPMPDPEPEPEPELKEPTKKEPTVEELKNAKPKKRGRKPDSKIEKIKTPITMSKLSKAELIKLVHSQQMIIDDKEKKEEEAITKSKEFIQSKLINKVKPKPKEKRPRTPAQEAAMAKLLEANKKRRENKRNAQKKEIKKEVKDEVDKDISNLVQDELVKIIQAPLRSLTPERMKKVKGVEDQNKKYKNKF